MLKTTFEQYLTLKRLKDGMYTDIGVHKTSLFENKADYWKKPGFFTPFKNSESIISQLKAPVYMPAACLWAAGICLAVLIKSLVSLEVEQTAKFATAVPYLICMAAIDTIHSLIAVITRTAATVVPDIGSYFRRNEDDRSQMPAMKL